MNTMYFNNNTQLFYIFAIHPKVIGHIQNVLHYIQKVNHTGTKI